MANLTNKPMSPLLAWGYLLALAAIICLIVYPPLQTTRERQIRELSDLEKHVAKQKSLLARSEKISRILKVAEIDKAKTKHIIRADLSTAIARFQSITRRMAETTNVSLTRIQTLNPKPKGQYDLLSIKIDGFSSLTELHNFLLELRKNALAIRVDDIDLIPVGATNRITKLHIGLGLSVLMDAVQ